MDAQIVTQKQATALKLPTGNETAVAMQNAGAPAELVMIANVNPQLAERALAIIMSQPVDQWHPALQPARAIAAALHEQKTGQICGQDFFADNRMGIVPGYRGRMREAADRNVTDYIDDYRVMRADELTANGIQSGDESVICELTIPSRAKACREAGIPFRPIIGIGIVRAFEKVNKNGEKIQLQGGYNWHRKARNRALKDALSHAGFAKTAKEVIESAAVAGLDLNFPADKMQHLDREQAVYLVKRAQEREETEMRASEAQAAALLARIEAEEAAAIEDGDFTPDDPDAALLQTVLVEITNEAMKPYTSPEPDKLARNAVTSLSRLFPDDTTRHAFCLWAFGVESTKDMSDAQRKAAVGFVGLAKVGEDWLPSDKARAVADAWKREHAREQAELPNA